jgi:hypothetical protein
MKTLLVTGLDRDRLAAAYSADRIAEGTCKVVLIDDVPYTCVGTVSGGKGGATELQVRRLVPRRQWTGRAYTYGQRAAKKVYGEGFYTGMRVRGGGTDYVIAAGEYTAQLRPLPVPQGRAAMARLFDPDPRATERKAVA